MKNLKIYEGLSSYLLAEDGTVYTHSNEPVKLTRENNYKLITDELFKIGDIHSRIVRRFTVDEVNKLWNSNKAFLLKKDVPKTEIENEKTFGTKSNGEVVEIAIKPGERSEFEKGLDRAGDTPMYTEDQKAASKRVVKINPKTPKALTEKVKKAIKETSGIIEVNGKQYPSARAAAKELKISVNTVLRKVKANKDGFSFLEK